MDVNFDFENFHRLLLEASRQAFTKIQQDHPDENFYAFGLFTLPLLGFVRPTANSEEGLQRKAQEYLARGWHETYEQTLFSLRDSPADWAYHLAYQELFTHPQLHELFYVASDALIDEEVFEVWEETFSKPIYAIFYKVLKQLDAEGLFGQGEKRNSVVINIWMGDESIRDRLTNAQQVNPPAAFEHYTKHMLALDEKYHSDPLLKEWLSKHL